MLQTWVGAWFLLPWHTDFSFLGPLSMHKCWVLIGLRQDTLFACGTGYREVSEHLLMLCLLGQVAQGGGRVTTMRPVGQWKGSGNSCLGQRLWLLSPWRGLEAYHFPEGLKLFGPVSKHIVCHNEKHVRKNILLEMMKWIYELANPQNANVTVHHYLALSFH